MVNLTDLEWERIWVQGLSIDAGWWRCPICHLSAKGQDGGLADRRACRDHYTEHIPDPPRPDHGVGDSVMQTTIASGGCATVTGRDGRDSLVVYNNAEYPVTVAATRAEE